MYAIYAYIDPLNHPNVSIYGIHGVFGISTIDQCKASMHAFETHVGHWVL